MGVLVRFSCALSDETLLLIPDLIRMVCRRSAVITFVILVTSSVRFIHVYAIAYMSTTSLRRRFFGHLKSFIAAMLTLALADLRRPPRRMGGGLASDRHRLEPRPRLRGG